MKTLAFSLSALLCMGFASARAADLANDEQKALYAIGVAVSQSLTDLSLSESELEIVKSGMSDGVLKRPLKVDPKAYAPKVQQLVQARAATVARSGVWRVHCRVAARATPPDGGHHQPPPS